MDTGLIKYDPLFFRQLKMKNSSNLNLWKNMNMGLDINGECNPNTKIAAYYWLLQYQSVEKMFKCNCTILHKHEEKMCLNCFYVLCKMETDVRFHHLKMLNSLFETYRIMSGDQSRFKKIKLEKREDGSRIGKKTKRKKNGKTT